MKTKAILFFTSAIFFLTLIPAFANAQFTKGDMLVEGSLGSINVSNTKSENEQNGTINSKNENKGFSIAILPRAGFFVSNNLVIGTTLGIVFYNNKYKNINPLTGNKMGEAKDNTTTLDVIPFVRYYFPGKSATTRFYGQVGGGISLDLSRKYESKNYNNAGVVTNSFNYNYPKKFNTVSGEALVGLNHFIAQNVAVNAGLGYNYSRGTETTSFTQNFGGPTTTSNPEKYTVKTGTFIWNVGFTMIVPCKKKK